jgi:phage tail sheath gpL-like
MAFSIPLTGLAANDPVPGNYLEINFAQGAASLGTATYPILLVGNKSTAGDATVNTVVYGPNSNSPLPLSSSADAIARFGQGAELHRMWRRVTKVNTVTPIYAIAVAESVGAAATQALTFATTATANGTARYYVGDEFVDTPITSGDTAIVIAGNVAASINSKLDWAVTAANSGTAICTLTAKNLGLRGNWLRGSCVISGSGVGTTSSITAQAFFTGGTTADTSTTALATILPLSFYYIVSAADDATQMGTLSTQVSLQAQPVTGIRQRVVAGSIDVAGTVNGLTAALNSARFELVWMEKLDWTPAELAANMAAVYALEEIPLSFRCNFSGYGSDAKTQATWVVPPAKSGTIPTRATIAAALNIGVTPIGTSASGQTYLVKRITTRYKSGSNLDYRIRDSHKVTVCDRFSDDWLSVCGLQFSGKKIANDPFPGQPAPGNDVITPRIVKGAIWRLLSDYGDLDLLQNVGVIKDGTLVIREASPTTRMSCKIPLQTIDILDQIATSLDQVA